MTHFNLKHLVFTLLIGVFVACDKDDPQPADAVFSISPKEHNFGEVEVEKTATHEFTITNKGESNLLLTAFTLDGTSKDEFTTTAKNTTVVAGKTYTFAVTFAPKSKGDKTATLKIATNIGEHTATLNGKALPKPAIVYVAGYEQNIEGNYIVKLWKNGVATALTYHFGKANSVFVANNDVYIAGNGEEWIATLWKNGVPTALSDGTSKIFLTSVFVVQE